MTTDVDSLLTIAEIAGVFVGVAALVSVISSRESGHSRPDDAFILFQVVITSVQVIGAALVPVLLFRYELSEPSVWRGSAGLAFALNWIVIHLVNRVTQGYARTHSRKRLVSFAAWTLEPVVQIPLLVCTVGAWQAFAPAFYLTAVVALLFQVMVLFLDLATSIIAATRD